MDQLKPVIYKNFKGINNLEDSYRLQQYEDGIALKDAKNVDINRTGMIESRVGTEIIWTHNTSDLYTNGRDVVGVVAGYLSVINPLGWSYIKLISGGNATWYYDSTWNKIFCSNNITIGYIQNNIWNSYPVISDTYKRQFPSCGYIHSYKNVMFGAIDETLIWSDPNNFFQVDIRNDMNYGQFPSNITMINSVTDGLWIGTVSGLWFLQGNSPGEFVFKQVSDCSVIPRTDRSLSYSIVKGEIWPEVVWVSTSKGIAALGDGGKFMRDMEYTYDMPNASKGTAYIRRGRINQYVAIIK